MHKRWQFPLCMGGLLAFAVYTEALVIHGAGSGGLQFEGVFTGITNGALTIRNKEGSQSTQIGIPISSLNSLSIELPSTPDKHVTRTLESLLPLIDQLDEASISSLLDYLEGLAVSGDWSVSGIWARRLGEMNLPVHLKTRVGLLKARSLHGLGLFHRLGEELDSLAGLFPPVEAPPIYCWLMATVLVRREDYQEARFWARLPFLKIPVSKKPVMQNLATLLDEIDGHLEFRIPFAE